MKEDKEKAEDGMKNGEQKQNKSEKESQKRGMKLWRFSAVFGVKKKDGSLILLLLIKDSSANLVLSVRASLSRHRGLQTNYINTVRLCKQRNFEKDGGMKKQQEDFWAMNLLGSFLGLMDEELSVKCLRHVYIYMCVCEQMIHQPPPGSC